MKNISLKYVLVRSGRQPKNIGDLAEVAGFTEAIQKLIASKKIDEYFCQPGFKELFSPLQGP